MSDEQRIQQSAISNQQSESRSREPRAVSGQSAIPVVQSSIGRFLVNRQSRSSNRQSAIVNRQFLSLVSGLSSLFLLVPALAFGLSSSAAMPRGECQMEPDTSNGLPANSKHMPALLRGVGITQRLNQQIPLDLPFIDQTGKAVRLGDYFGKKPVILSLVYFNCPNLCTMVENNLLQSLRRLKVFSVGRQFDVVTVSFDPHDTPTMAFEKWRIYAGLYGRKGSAQGWHFLTGSQASITALLNAVGYHVNYLAEAHQYAHAVGIMVLTPDGKLSKYFYGLEYPSGQIRMALDEASNDKIGSPVDALLLFCCSYNPVTGKYGLVIWHVLMVGGILTILLIGGLILLLVRWERRHPKKEQAEIHALEESVGARNN
jgi:protein SCO1/2